MDGSLSFEFQTIKVFDAHSLTALFQSVDWKVSSDARNVQQSLRGSDAVVSAWSGHQLVGLCNAISDGGLTVYIHYVLVHGDHQRLGIGMHLISNLLKEFPDYKHVVLASEKGNTRFFEKVGFYSAEPMRVFEMRRSR